MTSRRLSRSLTRAGLALAVALALAAVAAAETGREIISIDVTAPQPATITADLYTPSGPGPHPVVMLFHGCGGATPNVAAWARWLQAEGYAALAVHSFPGRGLRNLCADSSALRPVVRAGDVFAAAAKLRSIERIDKNRLAVIGFSHGGATALSAWRTAAQHPDTALRAVVAFYPGCRDVRALPTRTPLLILIGDKDDWTPADNCRRFAATMRAAGQPVTLVVYPDAQHHFDGAHLKERRVIAAAKGGQGATVEYNAAAHADAEKQVKQFLAAHMRP